MISLKFVPSGHIHNIPALVQIMAWRRPGDKPLSEPIMVSLLMHICITQPQWVNVVWSMKMNSVSGRQRKFEKKKKKNVCNYSQHCVCCCTITIRCLDVSMHTLQWCHNERDGISCHQLKIVYSTIYSGADQRKHQSSASLAFVQGIHRWPVNCPHKWPVTWKMFPFDDIIM